MIDENYAHHYGAAEEKKVYGIRVKNSFYVCEASLTDYILTQLHTHSLNQGG